MSSSSFPPATPFSSPQKSVALVGLTGTDVTKYVGATGIRDVAQRLGITPPSDTGINFAQGTENVPLLQMTGAYQVLANNGQRIAPVGILDVYDHAGHNIYHYNTEQPPTTQVVSAQITHIVTSGLISEPGSENTFGDDHQLSFADQDPNCVTTPACTYQVAAQSSDTNETEDGNTTIGYTPDVVVGAWVGNVNGKRMNSDVTIQPDAIDEIKMHQGSSGHLVVGDKMTLKDLVYGLMLPSGDDAAIAIADAVAGSPAAFVDQMNQYAQNLHLTHTHYINPDGLTYMTAQGTPDYNYTSAADLVQLTHVALKNTLFAQIVQSKEYKVQLTADHHAYDWVNTNTLLGTYPGATGVKTGFTLEAGYCLVFSAIKNGRYLIGAVLHDSTTNPDQRFSDATKLLNWGFALP